MKIQTLLSKLHRLEKQFRASAQEQIDLAARDKTDSDHRVVSIGSARAAFRDGVASALLDAANQIKQLAP